MNLARKLNRFLDAISAFETDGHCVRSHFSPFTMMNGFSVLGRKKRVTWIAWKIRPQLRLESDRVYYTMSREGKTETWKCGRKGSLSYDRRFESIESRSFRRYSWHIRPWHGFHWQVDTCGAPNVCDVSGQYITWSGGRVPMSVTEGIGDEVGGGVHISHTSLLRINELFAFVHWPPSIWNPPKNNNSVRNQ